MKTEQPSTEAIDRAVEAGRILERYEDPRLRPLSEANFRIYDAARREIAALKACSGPEPGEWPTSDEAQRLLAKMALKAAGEHAERLMEARALLLQARSKFHADSLQQLGWQRKVDAWIASLTPAQPPTKVEK